MSYINKVFDKVYVISLQDKTERWEKIKKQFSKYKIKGERFFALDGRCKDKKQCLDKLKTFEIISGLKIPITKEDYEDLNVISPKISLSVGLLMILKDMVKNNYQNILIFEPDIVLEKDFEKRFKEGIKEIGDNKWDLLYFGCGNECGFRGVSKNKTNENKIFSELAKIEGIEFYLANKDDTRRPCDSCKSFSKNLSIPSEPHGGFGIAYSLSGAKKIIKITSENDNILEHHDIVKGDYIKSGYLKAFTFDPPIIYHEGGVERTDTTIPWNW